VQVELRVRLLILDSVASRITMTCKSVIQSCFYLPDKTVMKRQQDYVIICRRIGGPSTAEIIKKAVLSQ